MCGRFVATVVMKTAVTDLAMETTTVNAIGTIGAKLTIIGGQIIAIPSILRRDHVERNGTG